MANPSVLTPGTPVRLDNASLSTAQKSVEMKQSIPLPVDGTFFHIGGEYRVQ
jgi:hypothetical protein